MLHTVCSILYAAYIKFYLVAEGGKIKDRAWSDAGFNRKIQQERHDKRMREQREDKKKAWDARSEIERKRKLPPRKCSFTSKTRRIVRDSCEFDILIPTRNCE